MAPIMAKSVWTSAFKVGLVTLLSLVLLVGAIIWLQGRTLNQGQDYTVLFSDVDGLRKGATVQMMGIRVGFVDAVDADVVDNLFAVRVRFVVSRNDIVIPRGSVLSIQQSGLVGEKFLEITPPRLQEANLIVREADLAQRLESNLPFPVKMVFQQGLLTVGQVERMERDVPRPINAHRDPLPPGASRFRFLYRLRYPGARLPEETAYRLVFPLKRQPYLLVVSQQEETVPPPVPDQHKWFTVENPMRFQEFLEVQIASALALKETNERINALLSDATIDDVQATLANLKIISGQAQQVMASADRLFISLERDLTVLSRSTQGLTTNLNTLSRNLNNLLGDTQLQSDIKATSTELRQVSETLNRLLASPELEQALGRTDRISQDLADISGTLKDTLANPQTQQQLENSICLLNDSLARLSSLLEQVEAITNEKEPALKDIVEDTRKTTDNLRQFSEKLTGRFVLWKLMF